MSETEVAGGAEAPHPGADATGTGRAEPAAGSAGANEAGESPSTGAAGTSEGGADPSPSAGKSEAGTPAEAQSSGDAKSSGQSGQTGDAPERKRRRRGSRGGRKRSSKARTDEARRSGDAGTGASGLAGVPAGERPGSGSRADTAPPSEDGGIGRGEGPDRRGRGGEGRGDNGRGGDDGGSGATEGQVAATRAEDGDDRNPELPERHREGKPSSIEAANRALVRHKPRIGDSIPPEALRRPDAGTAGEAPEAEGGRGKRRRRRRGGRGRSGGGKQPTGAKRTDRPVEAVIAHDPVTLDDEALERRRGRERKGRPVGRYSMCVHVSARATQIAVLEGRALIEHYVSHPSDDVSQIHGNVYLGRVQNVLPGMEAAFVDIGTPKNAVLYRGDVHYDPEDIEGSGRPRIEDVLKAGQTILCQVTKNPIGAKGARLTQEVSLPGRFVVLIPNSSTYGISKRLPDDERKRLRSILDKVKPAEHGVIVRTAAEKVTSEEIEDDVRRLLEQWRQIEALAKRSKAPALLYREPDMAVRVIREEFSQDYRSVLIDDRDLFNAVREYVGSISPELADRVVYYDPEAEALPLFERQHVHEQLHRALDRKVWLPSGGSLIIEHTEALTVIDVNTGKNVGKSSLEETVFKNNLEAAVEIARQLRLRDVGGIIVVDFIDMERKENRDEVVRVFREALSRDKTRTQVFEISELGLCEMTRKRIGEGLLESFARQCPDCVGRGVLIDKELLPD
jgi:ribonuclease E